MVAIIVVYVDDILITGDAHTEIHAISDFLHSEFKVKDLGDIHYILGLEILRENKALLYVRGSSP